MLFLTNFQLSIINYQFAMHKPRDDRLTIHHEPLTISCAPQFVTRRAEVFIIIPLAPNHLIKKATYFYPNVLGKQSYSQSIMTEYVP